MQREPLEPYHAAFAHGMPPHGGLRSGSSAGWCSCSRCRTSGSRYCSHATSRVSAR